MLRAIPIILTLAYAHFSFAGDAAPTISPITKSSTQRSIGRWDTRFGPGPGVNGAVEAEAVMDGSLYVAGEFSTVGNKTIHNIARWDGRQWHDVGGGINGWVIALAVYNHKLYAGGYFSMAGTTAVSNIAVWNASRWMPLGAGLSGDPSIPPGVFVSSLAIHDGKVYAGGSFQNSGSLSISNLARWDGAHWSSVGGGVSGLFAQVYGLSFHGNHLYAGGFFQSAGGVAVTNIARWDGTEWSALGLGVSGGSYVVNGFQGDLSGMVNSLAFVGERLFVGGDFSNAGGKNIKNLAVLENGEWGGTGADFDGSVGDILTARGQLYVAGSFTHVGEQNANGVAQWNGASLRELTNSAQGLPDSDPAAGKALAWKPLEPGIVGQAGALRFFGPSLYVGGYFGGAGNRSAGSIARWTQGHWSTLGIGSGQGLLGYPFTVAAQGKKFFLSGYLYAGGRTRLQSVAAWEGDRWANLKENISGYITSMAAGDQDVYVGGSVRISTNAYCPLAHWDGKHWSEVPGISGSSVYSLAVSGSNLFVGGYLSLEGGENSHGIARWDGTNWFAVPMPQPGYSLAYGEGIGADATNLYAALQYTPSVYDPPRDLRIACWNGSDWTNLGGVLSGSEGSSPPWINHICVHGKDVYISGGFTAIGDVAVTNLAHWDGTAWDSLGNAIDSDESYVGAVAASDRGVYVGGYFNHIAGISAHNIARWDGQKWSSLEGGLTDNPLSPNSVSDVTGIAVSGKKICVVGHFTRAGKTPSENIAIWTEIR